jgi:hypothetical protein
VFADSADGTNECAGDLGIAVPRRQQVENRHSLGVSRGALYGRRLRPR